MVRALPLSCYGERSGQQGDQQGGCRRGRWWLGLRWWWWRWTEEDDSGPLSEVVVVRVGEGSRAMSNFGA